jgi:hypothetical protein
MSFSDHLLKGPILQSKTELHRFTSKEVKCQNTTLKIVIVGFYCVGASLKSLKNMPGHGGIRTYDL